MKKINRKKKEFKQLKVGRYFKFNGILYIKDEDGTGIRLSTGFYHNFGYDELVTPVKVKIIVK